LPSETLTPLVTEDKKEEEVVVVVERVTFLSLLQGLELTMVGLMKSKVKPLV